MIHRAGLNDWVIVMYEGAPYFGQVLSIEAPHWYEVKTVYSPEGTNWFIWSSEAVIWYKEVAHVVSAPDLANNRGAYRFQAADYQKYFDLLS